MLTQAAEEAEKLQTRINKLEAKAKRSFWVSTISISLMGLVPLGIGAVEYCKGDTYGKDYMWTGAALLIGGQLIYQGGHWIFNLW